MSLKRYKNVSGYTKMIGVRGEKFSCETFVSSEI